jgi:SAM-dependent methyltransferase
VIISGMAEAPEHPIFARFYERMIAGSERAGLAEMRRSLLARASGRTLEIGAGTGLDLAHYGDADSELVLTEPDPHMAARLRQRLQSESFAPGRIKVVEATAEDLPFDDGSFDTVVSALVLCTVEDPGRPCRDGRVLVEGRAAFLSTSAPNRRAWQDRRSGLVVQDRHPTACRLLADAGLWIEQLDRGRFPVAAGIGPIAGYAAAAAGAGDEPAFVLTPPGPRLRPLPRHDGLRSARQPSRRPPGHERPIARRAARY